MRVGIDIASITASRTGVGNYCFYLLKHLVKLAPDCAFLGFASGVGRIDLGPLAHAVAQRRIPLPTRLLYQTWRRLGMPKVDTFLGGVDVFHATNVFLPPTRSARTVLTIHDLSFLTMPELCSPKIAHTFASGVREFAARSDAVLVYSRAVRDELANLAGVAPAKITVTPIGTDDDFRPVPPDTAVAYLLKHYGIRPPFFLFVGTLEPRKNVPALLRAFAQVAKELPHRLVLVGRTGWNAEPIFNTIRELNLSDRVVQVGYVPSHLDLTHFYSAAEALVFPTFYEGFGLPVLEAMTCGCPVITSTTPAVDEVAGDAALCIAPSDVEGFAQAMERIVADAPLRKSLITRGQERAKMFSWEECARLTFDRYRSLAQ